MQVALQATRRTPRGGSRLVQTMMFAWSVKIRRAPVYRCEGLIAVVIRLLQPCTSVEYISPDPHPLILSRRCHRRLEAFRVL